MMIVIDCEPGSSDWIAIRLGVMTGSGAYRIVTPTGKLSSQRSGYLAELLAEWATGEPGDEFMGTYWTDRGTELEPEAIAFYEMQTDKRTSRPGFVFRDSSRTVGCSPDWLEDGGLGELKCPKKATHIGYLVSDGMPAKYIPQVQFNLWCTALPVAHFMSYYPGLPPLLVEVEPDARYHDAFAEHVPAFLAELERGRERLRALGIEGGIER